MNTKDFFSIFDTILAWRIYACKRIRNAQALPFKCTERVIRKNLHAFYVMECMDKIRKAMQAVIIIASARYQHVSDPDWFVQIGKYLGHAQNVCICMAGQDTVHIIIDLLDIEHDKIRVFHQFEKPGIKRIFFCEGCAARIERRVYAFLLCFLKQIDQKFYLQKRFAAAYGDAAFFSPVGAVAQSLAQ